MWGQLPRMVDIEDTVAKAVDGAYDALTQGRAIRSLGAWLWKAADNQANDRWRDDHSLRAAGDGDIDGIPGEMPLTDAERLDREELADNTASAGRVGQIGMGLDMGGNLCLNGLRQQSPCPGLQTSVNGSSENDPR